MSVMSPKFRAFFYDLFSCSAKLCGRYATFFTYCALGRPGACLGATLGLAPDTVDKQMIFDFAVHTSVVHMRV